MYEKLDLPKNKPVFYTAAIVTGAAAGLLNGFLGSGGGMILIFSMAFLLPRADVKEKFATAVASILPMSVVSAVFYGINGEIPFEGISRFLIPAALGGLTGAFVMEKLSPRLLKTVFALLMVYAGFRLISRA